MIRLCSSPRPSVSVSVLAASSEAQPHPRVPACLAGVRQEAGRRPVGVTASQVSAAAHLQTRPCCERSVDPCVATHHSLRVTASLSSEKPLVDVGTSPGRAAIEPDRNCRVPPIIIRARITCTAFGSPRQAPPRRGDGASLVLEMCDSIAAGCWTCVTAAHLALAAGKA